MTNNFGVKQPQMQQNIQQQEQPYYLFCGNKTDWDEFLMLNYNITEQNIFDDYKLFLQAKQEDLKDVGIIIKDIFEQDGYIPCIAQKVQKMLYRNIIKNERAIQKFEDCDWSNEVIYIHDKYLHNKMKHEEHKDV